jgi:hypothetical protein
MMCISTDGIPVSVYTVKYALQFADETMEAEACTP